MTILLNSFEGGTSGTTITTGNSGTSGDAFDAVSTSAGATTAYDNAHAAHGGLSAKLATVASGTTYLQWSSSLTGTTVPQVWFRQYMYVTANPGAAVRILSVNTAAAVCASFVLQTTGAIQVNDTSGAQVLLTTATIPLNAWFRIEGFVIGSAASGQVSISLYDSPDSTTPTETDTSSAAQNTSGAITQIRYGISAAIANAVPFWIDDIGVSTTGALGPAGMSLQPPSSIYMAQASVPASSTVAVFTVPPGVNNVVIFQVTQAQAVYIGTSARVSATTGMQVPTTPLSSEIYIASSGATYYATTGNGTASSFSYLISSGK